MTDKLCHVNIYKGCGLRGATVVITTQKHHAQYFVSDFLISHLELIENEINLLVGIHYTCINM